jgi:pimeloyl-ACP methyl ester carboxylesterase
VRETVQGDIALAYDPGIAVPLRAAPARDVDLWPVWDRVACPVLVLRGATSDVLRRVDAEAMTRRGPKARLHEFAIIGHAPSLMSPEQIALVRDFLLADAARG